MTGHVSCAARTAGADSYICSFIGFTWQNSVGNCVTALAICEYVCGGGEVEAAEREYAERTGGAGQCDSTILPHYAAAVYYRSSIVRAREGGV